jgi:hypothetical protein
MSDIKLFRLIGNKATEIPTSASTLEKPLQNLIEQNLEVLLGIPLSGYGVFHRQDTRRPHRYAGPRRGQLPGHHRVQTLRQRERHQPGPVLPGLAS